MERIFGESELDWTMVRPPQLTDKPYTGKYRVQEGRLPLFGFKISRADVADFMIKAVENPSTAHKVVGVLQLIGSGYLLSRMSSTAEGVIYSRGCPVPSFAWAGIFCG